jgi:hypothetical protein
VLRGWTTRYKYLSERKQRTMLIDAGAEERVIYPEADQEAWIRSMRPGDEAIVADLRVFGSRKALGEASAAIAAKGATLVTCATDVRIHHPTLADVQRTESLWAGERSMGSSKRAKELSARGNEARQRNIAASRLDKEAAGRIWRDLKRYPSAEEALENMPGWTRTTAWRHFKGREPVEPEPVKPKRKTKRKA